MVDVAHIASFLADNWVRVSTGAGAAGAVLHRRRAHARERAALTLLAADRAPERDDPASVSAIIESDNRNRAALFALPNDVLMLLVGCCAQLPLLLVSPQRAGRNLRAIIETFADRQAGRAGADLTRGASVVVPPAPVVTTTARVAELHRGPTALWSHDSTRHQRHRRGAERHYVTRERSEL